MVDPTPDGADDRSEQQWEEREPQPAAQARRGTQLAKRGGYIARRAHRNLLRISSSPTLDNISQPHCDLQTDLAATDRRPTIAAGRRGWTHFDRFLLPRLAARSPSAYPMLGATART